LSLERLEPRIQEKHWDKSIELQLIKEWEREGFYEFRYDEKRPLLVIDTPPPYPSGKWHVGGAAHYAQIDMIARYFRMKGWNVLVPWYADRNGLPIEVAVEKKHGIIAHEMARTVEGRLRFLELCRKELDAVEAELVRIWKRLGCCFTYWRNGTDSPEYRKLTQATFIELWRRGLVYEAEKPVTWCPRCRTSLSEAEIEYREEEGVLYYIRWKVKETGEYIVIATTRPELLAAARAVVFHPDDERYRRLRGLHAIVPIYGYEVPILTHPAVDPSFGTGLVMVCSYGDWTDVMMLNDLGLKPHVIVKHDGSVDDGRLIRGLPVKEARKRIVEVLRREGLIEKEEKLVHNVPVCWRCKTPIEIVHVREFFLKQLEYRDQLKKIAEEMIVKPEKHRRKLIEWIEGLKMDWPISRTRFYGTEVPLWRCRRCGRYIAPEPGRYYRPWLEKPPFDKCPYCGAPSSELEGETRVFDTWFDSSISVLYVSGYMRDEKIFAKAFPKDEPLPYTLRPQGVDIIRTWLYFSILRVYQLLGKPAFRWVRITGMGLDPQGRAMHKSLGNVIDPEPYLERYGADAFRYWAAASAKLGDDYRFSEQLIRTGHLFASKLWNIARFVSAFPRPSQGYRLRPVDKIFLAKLNDVIRTVDRAYGEELDVYVPITVLYDFTWNVFASHYIELVKSRAYNREGRYSREEQQGAWYTLHTILDSILRMLAPIMPFVTDALYRRLYHVSVHKQKFPEPLPVEAPVKHVELVMAVNSAVWGWKKRRNLKLSEYVRDHILYVDKSLEPYLDELKDLHRIEVRTGEPPAAAKVEKILESPATYIVRR
jgi:valyl-tRNA synthetase